jgi:hypothetical protein
MRTRRLTGLGLGVLATVALALAGCADDSAAPPAASPSPAPSSCAVANPAAADQLGTAAATLGNTSFKIAITAGPGVNLTGQIDPPGGKGTATLALSGPNANLKVTSLLIGQDLYAQVPGITKAGTWAHLDVSRLPAGANVVLRPGQIDPANTARLLSTTTDVQPNGARSYRGTVDLTKAIGLTGVDQVTVNGLGSAATKVPFTAGLDDQGRLAELTLQIPAVNGRPSPPVDILYTDYGAPVTVQRPDPSETTEAPDNVYTALGGR